MESMAKVGTEDFDCFDLADSESSADFMELEGVTTITHYDGVAPISYLQQKLNEIVKLNPWLDGRLIKSKKKVQVKYPKVPKQHDAGPAVAADSGVGGAKLTVVETDHLNLTDADCKEYNIKSGSKLLGKDYPLFQVVVFKNKDSSKFALFSSLSHVIADGHTYYKIHSMLSQNTESSAAFKYNEPKELLVQRENEVMKKITKFQEQEHSFFGSAGLICNVLGHMVFHGPPTNTKYLVNPDFIKAAKDAHASTVAAEKGAGAGAGAGTGSEPTASPAFISTNDILTSTVMRAMKCDVGFMAVNYRGRVEGATEDHAGNYEGVPAYCPEDFETPALIRHSVASGSFHRVKTSGKEIHPGFFKRRRCRVGIVTSWCSFYKPVEFDDCVQTMHLPSFPINAADGLTYAVFFTARPGQYAMLLIEPDHLVGTVSSELQKMGVILPFPEVGLASVADATDKA